MKSSARQAVFFASLATGLCAAALPARADGLTVTIYGGEWGDALTACVLDPFTKATGIKITPEPGVSTITLAKLRQQKGDPSIDVAWIDGGVSEVAAAEDLLQPLTVKTVPNIANVAQQGIYKTPAGDIYAISTGFYSMGLVYNTKEVKTAPTSWWDLEKPEYAGASTVPSPSNAMGVPLFIFLNKLAGGSTTNFEPGVKKYREMKVSSYFDSSGAATNSFQSGEVIIGAHYASSAWALADKNLPISYAAPKEGAPSGDIRVHVVKGTKNLDAALKFADFAIAKEQAGCLAEKVYVAPATNGVVLSEKAKSRMPWGKDGSLANLAVIDWVEVNANRQAVNDLWNREVARK